MKKVFIIILNWNRAQDTLECLKSINQIQHAKFDIKIVVVDNGSTDDSVKILKKIQKPKFKLLINKENLGFSGGNNTGIRYAIKDCADFIVVLNNDTLVEKSFIENFIKFANKDKRIGILSPKIYFEKGFEFHKDRYGKSDLGKVIWATGGKFDFNNYYGSNSKVNEVDKGQYEKILDIDFAPGTCLFIRKEVFEDIGVFDENFFMYLEDIDLSFRARKKNWKIKYLPTSIIWHKVAASSGIGSDLNDYFITRNRLLLGLRYASFRTKFALFRESLKLLFKGRKWQRIGVRDFYLGNLGKGSWPT